jgi:hypothetical protein
LTPTVYQICDPSSLTERMVAALEGMTPYAGAFDTVFTGEVKDHSQLYGLLNRLLELGLELISMEPQTEAGGATDDDQTAR